MTNTYDVAAVRRLFPALGRTENGMPAAYLDGPGGTQVAQTVIDAMAGVLRNGVSNLGGGFGASEDAVRITHQARAAMARFFNCGSDEVSFGQNMTSLTFAMSRALSRTWRRGDSIVLTSLDHDANFTPWTMVAEEVGAEVRVAEFDPRTGALDPDAVVELIDGSTQLVAVCLASNALGTVVDVAALSGAAHEMGALVYVDAVHAGPHVHIDVGTLGCDFLVASSYKFFGPHTGILYGNAAEMATLDAYKVRPAPSDPPGKWETGTQSFESLAGVTAAVEYLETLGSGSVASAFEVIGNHEQMLGRRFLDGIGGMPGVRLYGRPEMDGGRVATFAVAVDGMDPDQVAARMASAGIYVWSGHYYAVNVMDRLGLADGGGLVRIGFCHYNTIDELDRVLEVLGRLPRS